MYFGMASQQSMTTSQSLQAANVTIQNAIAQSDKVRWIRYDRCKARWRGLGRQSILHR